MESFDLVADEGWTLDRNSFITSSFVMVCSSCASFSSIRRTSQPFCPFRSPEKRTPQEIPVPAANVVHEPRRLISQVLIDLQPFLLQAVLLLREYLFRHVFQESLHALQECFYAILQISRIFLALDDDTQSVFASTRQQPP